MQWVCARASRKSLALYTFFPPLTARHLCQMARNHLWLTQPDELYWPSPCISHCILFYVNRVCLCFVFRDVVFRRHRLLSLAAMKNCIWWVCLCLLCVRVVKHVCYLFADHFKRFVVYLIAFCFSFSVEFIFIYSVWGSVCVFEVFFWFFSCIFVDSMSSMLFVERWAANCSTRNAIAIITLYHCYCETTIHSSCAIYWFLASKFISKRNKKLVSCTILL